MLRIEVYFSIELKSRDIYADRDLNLSAAQLAANEFGFTIGITLHVPWI
jgi:hypothetical protein